MQAARVVATWAFALAQGPSQSGKGEVENFLARQRMERLQGPFTRNAHLICTSQAQDDRAYSLLPLLPLALLGGRLGLGLGFSLRLGGLGGRRLGGVGGGIGFRRRG